MSTSLLILSTVLSMPAWSQNYVPGEVIVKLKNTAGGPSTSSFVSKASSEKEMKLRGAFGKMGMYHFSLKAGQSVEQAISELEKDPAVEYAEPNYYFRKSDLNDNVQVFSKEEMQVRVQDSGYVSAQGLVGAQSSGCMTESVGSNERPIVAVIDTGLDTSHSAFVNSDAVWTNPYEIPGNGIDDDGNGYVDDIHGWNFVSNSGNVYDDDTPGHGTHVAGIVLSVCYDIYNAPVETSKIRIMPLKFLDSSGVGRTSDAIKAIYYAVNNGARVLNNSWGGPSYSGALQQAIVYAYEHGVSFVAAAGNAGTDNDFSPMYPANYNIPNVISVAATTSLDALAWFSNYGSDSVHLGSPGVDVDSTLPGDTYGVLSGTSMATPFVAGTAIMMAYYSPNMLAYQMRQIIFNTADYKSSLANKVMTDSRLDAAGSMSEAKVATVDDSQPVYTYSNQDRQLASSLASGGCGLVSKMADDFTHQQRGGGGASPNTWYILVLISVLLAPVLLYNYLRSRKPENRRRYQRFKMSSQVVMCVGDKELIGSISTISLGGAQINTDALLNQGGVVQMTISSPDGRETVQVEGHVVWSEARKAYGVQFAHAKQGALEKISQWTKGLSKA